jgi:hypothetical protein
VKATADLAAAKVTPTLELTISGMARNVTVTVGELKAKVCDPVGPAAQKYNISVAEKNKASEERFTKYGVKGDKLALLKEEWGFLYLTGGDAPDDVKKYATASVFFKWTTSDADAAGFVTHTVRKHVFNGNTLVKTSEKSYRKRKGEKLGDVFH